jgi:hypothetical protein
VRQVISDLTDYIVVTEPLLSKEILEQIVMLTDGVDWRHPPNDGNYVRTCTTFPLSAAAVQKYPIPEGRLDYVKWADRTLVTATRQALRVYQKKYPRAFTRSDVGFDILRYEEGQSIGDHVDDREPRVLSMSIALNNGYTGGEFRFWKYLDVAVPAGCAIMFPPNFMFPHEVLPVTSGTRYSMITWYQ